MCLGLSAATGGLLAQTEGYEIAERRLSPGSGQLTIPLTALGVPAVLQRLFRK